MTKKANQSTFVFVFVLFFPLLFDTHQRTLLMDARINCMGKYRDRRICFYFLKLRLSVFVNIVVSIKAETKSM